MRWACLVYLPRKACSNMAKKKSIKRKRRPSATRKGKSKPLPTWVFVGAGILVGLVVGGLIQLVISRTSSPDSGLRALMTSGPGEEARVTAPKKTVQKKSERTKYDFYTILPEIETVLPDSGRASAIPLKTNKNVRYVLQAGSFARFVDADRLKASLTLNGLDAKIQKVSIENKGDFHRVRLGPYMDFSQLEQTHARLQSLGIKAIRLKVRDQR